MWLPVVLRAFTSLISWRGKIGRKRENFFSNHKTSLGLSLVLTSKETELYCLARQVRSYLRSWAGGHPTHSALLLIRGGTQRLQGGARWPAQKRFRNYLESFFLPRKPSMKNLLVEFKVMFSSHYTHYILYRGGRCWKYGKQLTKYFLWLPTWEGKHMSFSFFEEQ